MHFVLVLWRCLQKACKIFFFPYKHKMPAAVPVLCRLILIFLLQTEKKSTRELELRTFTIWMMDCGTWRRINDDINTCNAAPCPHLALTPTPPESVALLTARHELPVNCLPLRTYLCNLLEALNQLPLCTNKNKDLALNLNLRWYFALNSIKDAHITALPFDFRI